jgi:hypothetical protein
MSDCALLPVRRYYLNIPEFIRNIGKRPDTG